MKGGEESLRGKQLEIERMEKHSSKLQVDFREEQLDTHTGVNKKLQAQLGALWASSLNQMNISPIKKGAEVEDIKDPLGLPDIPMVTTRGKGAGKAAKVNSAAVVMKSEGEKTAKKDLNDWWQEVRRRWEIRSRCLQKGWTRPVR